MGRPVRTGADEHRVDAPDRGLTAIEKLLPWTVLTVGRTAAALAVLRLAIMLVPDHVPWLTIPMSM